MEIKGNDIRWKNGNIESNAFKESGYIENINYCRLYKIRFCRG